MHSLPSSRHVLVSVTFALVAIACGSSKSTSSSGTGASSTSVASTTSSSSGDTTTSSATGTASTTSSSSTTGAGSGSTSTSGGGALCGGSPNLNVGGLATGIFQATEPWNTDVSGDAVSPSSDAIINGLANVGGWGNGNKLQVDFSINILCADATTPMTTYAQPNGACTPDCDANTTFPVPPGGAVEGETGYACNGGGDCHLLVVDKSTNMLWEMWEAFSPPDATTFNSGSGVFLWDLTKAYPMNLRGDGCTSADAGGFPIAAMLFTADEVAAGAINHAIRFILPNARIMGPNGSGMPDVYVHPGTHTTSATSGPYGTTPPYGAHLRLKSSFDVTTLPSKGDQVVAKAMQKYGMFLADGGNIALTAANDQFTTAKWADADVNIGSHDFASIQVTDFELVDYGALVTTGDNCIRN